MGASMSWLSGLLFAKKEIRILILGLVFCSPLSLGSALELIGGGIGQCGKDYIALQIEGLPSSPFHKRGTWG
jgi:hypothetical protein